MRLTATIVVAILLPGCLGQPPIDSGAGSGPATDVEPCLWQPHPQSAEVKVSGHFLRTLGDGYTAAGRYRDFNWSADPADLVRLELRLEWDAATPASSVLGMGIPNDLGGWDHYAYGFFEGPSPLAATIEAPDVALIGEDLTVNYGPAENQTPAGGIVREQPALLVVQETYRCAPTGSTPPPPRSDG